ncbi:MAG: hypothetical protein AAGA42_20810 [Actinomycetota bacterium]
MTTATADDQPVIDRDIAELFMRNADDPIKTHVMGLVHDWWATAPQSAIDQYAGSRRTSWVNSEWPGSTTRSCAPPTTPCASP